MTTLVIMKKYFCYLFHYLHFKKWYDIVVKHGKAVPDKHPYFYCEKCKLGFSK